MFCYWPHGTILVEKLAEHGAKLVIISNSSRRSCTTIEKLKSLGFNSSLFSGAITSGELTHQYLLRSDSCYSWWLQVDTLLFSHFCSNLNNNEMFWTSWLQCQLCRSDSFSTFLLKGFFFLPLDISWQN